MCLIVLAPSLVVTPEHSRLKDPGIVSRHFILDKCYDFAPSMIRIILTLTLNPDGRKLKQKNSVSLYLNDKSTNYLEKACTVHENDKVTNCF